MSERRRTAERPRIAIVDDHVLVADGVCDVQLGSEEDFHVVGVAHDLETASALIERARPDTVSAWRPGGVAAGRRGGRGPIFPTVSACLPGSDTGVGAFEKAARSVHRPLTCLAGPDATEGEATGEVETLTAA